MHDLVLRHLAKPFDVQCACRSEQDGATRRVWDDRTGDPFASLFEDHSRVGVGSDYRILDAAEMRVHNFEFGRAAAAFSHGVFASPGRAERHNAIFRRQSRWSSIWSNNLPIASTFAFFSSVLFGRARSRITTPRDLDATRTCRLLHMCTSWSHRSIIETSGENVFLSDLDRYVISPVLPDSLRNVRILLSDLLSS